MYVLIHFFVDEENKIEVRVSLLKTDKIDYIYRSWDNKHACFLKLDKNCPLFYRIILKCPPCMSDSPLKKLICPQNLNKNNPPLNSNRPLN